MNDPHPPTAPRRGRLLLIGGVAALLVAAGALFALQRGTTDLRADAAAAAADMARPRSDSELDDFCGTKTSGARRATNV